MRVTVKLSIVIIVIIADCVKSFVCAHGAFYTQIYSTTVGNIPPITHKCDAHIYTELRLIYYYDVNMDSSAYFMQTTHIMLAYSFGIFFSLRLTSLSIRTQQNEYYNLFSAFATFELIFSFHFSPHVCGRAFDCLYIVAVHCRVFTCLC